MSQYINIERTPAPQISFHSFLSYCPGSPSQLDIFLLQFERRTFIFRYDIISNVFITLAQQWLHNFSAAFFYFPTTNQWKM